MRVEVDMPNANDALVPGMYVTVAFRLQARGLVEVPAAALIFRAGRPAGCPGGRGRQSANS